MCVYNSLTVHGILYCTMYTWRFQRFQRKTAHKMLNPIRRVINCWSLIGRQIWSSSDLQFWRYGAFYFPVFWLEIAYSRPFFVGEGFRGIFPQNMATHRFNPQKDHSCTKTSVKIGPTVRPVRRSEKKGKDSQKVTN